ncbi:Zn-finger containing protein [Clostridium carboxidivorans P7]|uniref:Zn-finger containing protein n=1 Tax=Clostridium carboxidivorans TaxID=217159 RepID=UPI00064F256E|nr:Zn-finger containing protein [Clostridium carboxidivorans]AKN32396.1 Zn-finger containing protein [Clostridium carboxidivorans P7]
MLNIYTSYRCRTCKKEFVLLTDDVDNMANGRYLTCPYCNSKRVVKEKASDSLKECMQERSYRRVNGAIKQVR